MCSIWLCVKLITLFSKAEEKLAFKYVLRATKVQAYRLRHNGIKRVIVKYGNYLIFCCTLTKTSVNKSCQSAKSCNLVY